MFSMRIYSLYFKVKHDWHHTTTQPPYYPGSFWHWIYWLNVLKLYLHFLSVWIFALFDTWNKNRRLHQTFFFKFLSTWNLIVWILVSCISHVFRSKFSILKSISCASCTILFHMGEIRFVYIFCILFCALQKHKKMFASAHTHTIIWFYSRLFQINMFIYISTIRMKLISAYE